MKKIMITITVVMLMTVLATTAAFASNYDSVANELSQIGMFRGTGTGFELDRAPTRAEAATMLVRIYGAEDEAEADFTSGKITNPFTDVKNNAAPYIAWIYNKGLTNGTSSTTFTPNANCDAKMYCAFVLRALGYDSSDFKYADVLTFAEQKGFYSSTMFTGPFTRDDMAAVTYQALAVNLKDGSTYLLDSLVKSGAVDKTAAAPITSKIETYRAMEKATKAADSSNIDADINQIMDYSMTISGQETTGTSTTTGNIKVITKDSDIQMASEMDTVAEGATSTIEMWLKDGWMYMNMTTGTETVKYKYSVGDELSTAMSDSGMEMLDDDMSALAVIKSIDAKTSGTDTVYTMVLNGDGISSLTDDVIKGMGADKASIDNLDIGDMTMTVTVSSTGALKNMAMKYGMTMTATAAGETMSMTADYDMTMKINKTGSNVSITFPDFSDYEEMNGAAA